MLLFIRRREEILHFQTTSSPPPPPLKTTRSLSPFPKFLSSRLLLPPTPFVLARGEYWLSITIYSDSRSTSGSNLTGLCTLKNAYLRATMLSRVELQSDTRVTPRCGGLSRITVLWSRVKERGYRGFFELCILMQPLLIYILDVFIQSLMIIIGMIERFS